MCISIQCPLRPSAIPLTLCSNVISSVCPVHTGDSYGQDLALGGRNSGAALPVLASAKGRAWGTGWTAYASKQPYRQPHPLQKQSSCHSSELVVNHDATLSPCTGRVVFPHPPIPSCSCRPRFHSKQVTFTFLFFCKQSTEI